MLALLEWAADHPQRWHDIGTLPESQNAAELLAKRGVIEIRQPMNQYRLKPAPKIVLRSGNCCMSDSLGLRAGLDERANLADLRLFLCNSPGFCPWCQRGVDLALRYVG